MRVCVCMCETKLTPRCRVYPDKFRGLHLAQKFPVFFKPEGPLPHPSPCHLSLSLTRSFQSKPSHLTAWRPILILSSHLRRGLPNGTSTSDPSAKSYGSTRCAKLQGLIVWVVLSKNCYISIWLIDRLTARSILLYQDILRLYFLRTAFTYVTTSGKNPSFIPRTRLVHRPDRRDQ